jgi:hypothetical protein
VIIGVYELCFKMIMTNFFVLDSQDTSMERSKRIRKPNMRYDPNIYVLASFPKKKKHTVIPKHQVVIDAIDEHNGTIKSSGFAQPVRIIAEGKIFLNFSNNYNSYLFLSL